VNEWSAAEWTDWREAGSGTIRQPTERPSSGWADKERELQLSHDGTWVVPR
jgi:hypothetical protein